MCVCGVSICVCVEICVCVMCMCLCYVYVCVEMFVWISVFVCPNSFSPFFLLSFPFSPHSTPFTHTARPLEEHRIANVTKYLSERKVPYDVYSLAKVMHEKERSALTATSYNLQHTITLHPPSVANPYVSNCKFQQVPFVHSHIHSYIHSHIHTLTLT